MQSNLTNFSSFIFLSFDRVIEQILLKFFCLLHSAPFKIATVAMHLSVMNTTISCKKLSAESLFSSNTAVIFIFYSPAEYYSNFLSKYKFIYKKLNSVLVI